jgi:hypothetical protein
MSWDVRGYRLGEKLGAGAFGEVRLGVDKHSGRKVREATKHSQQVNHVLVVSACGRRPEPPTAGRASGKEIVPA